MALSRGPALTVSEQSVSLSSQQREAQFALGTSVYTVRLESRAPDLCDAAVTLARDRRTQRLYGPDQHRFACDEPHFEISWAGDLDRDGRLDLLTTFSSKYSYYPRQLWLSSAASPGELISEVGRYDRFAQ